MQTIDEVREHCRFVGKGIEKTVADGEDLTAKFEGTQLIWYAFDAETRAALVEFFDTLYYA